jgi:hypothetical protein
MIVRAGDLARRWRALKLPRSPPSPCMRRTPESLRR